MNGILIRHAEPSDYESIISVVDEWWGGRRMAAMLPKLFFVHFQPTSFIGQGRTKPRCWLNVETNCRDGCFSGLEWPFCHRNGHDGREGLPREP
jgi:hypothetical protein